MNFSPRLLVPAFLLSALVGCVPAAPGAPAPASCPADSLAWIRDVLYLGRSIPGGGTVSDADWSRFVAEVLGPAFPDGFTVLEGTGQWRSADGTVASEASLVVSILHADSPDAAAKLLRVGASYRERFRQEAVLHEHQRVCVTFITG
jgi:hypothetical protein